MAKRKQGVNRPRRTYIDENLKRFLPPVSRMGGTNPDNWRWYADSGKNNTLRAAGGRQKN